MAERENRPPAAYTCAEVYEYWYPIFKERGLKCCEPRDQYESCFACGNPLKVSFVRLAHIAKQDVKPSHIHALCAICAKDAALHVNEYEKKKHSELGVNADLKQIEEDKQREYWLWFQKQNSRFYREPKEQIERFLKHLEGKIEKLKQKKNNPKS